MSEWTYDGKELLSVPYLAYGFVYRISFDDESWYVGRKSFYTERRAKPTKDMRKNAKRIVRRESNWKKYCSSSDEVKEKVLAGLIPSREVLYICCSKTELTYMENKYLYCLGALEDSMCLNKNIGGKIYRSY